MKDEHRSEPRELVKLPVGLAGGKQTVTRDISATGLFFEMDSEQQVGGLIDLEIELDTPSGPVKLVAQGQIMRIVQQAGKTGVGIKLLTSRLEPVK